MKTIFFPTLFFFIFTSVFPVSAADSQTQKTARVSIAPIRKENPAMIIKTAGRLEPDIEELSFQIPGRLVELSVDTGDTVKKGQVLARLEMDDALNVEKNTAVILRQAERKFDHIKNLYAKKTISTDDFDDAQDALEQAKINHDQASLNVKRCILSAPCNGKILNRHLDYLTTVSPGMPIYSSQNTEKPWIVKTHIADQYAFSLDEGCPARVTFAPYPEKSLDGVITLVAQKANPSDGLYEIEITISPEAEMELKPGLLAEVEIIQKSTRVYSVVPFSALLNLRGMTGHVFVVDKGLKHAVKKNITVRSLSGEDATLEEDLSSHEYVITHGNQEIEDGDIIEVTGQHK